MADQNFLHDGTEILKIEKKGRGMYTRYTVHLKSEKFEKWFEGGIKRINFDYDMIQCLNHSKLGPKLFDHINSVGDAIDEGTTVSEWVTL